LNTRIIRVDGSRLKDDLLPHLCGQVFHVTFSSAFERIHRERWIRHNHDGRYEFTFPQSQISYARAQRCVSLFDLRGKSDTQVEEILEKLYFLNPTGKDDPVFLLLASQEYSKLVAPPSTHTEVDYKFVWIPNGEVLYPGDIPIEAIAEVVVPVIFYTPEYLAKKQADEAASAEVMRQILETRYRRMVEIGAADTSEAPASVAGQIRE
jgi:hypothetical protein